MGQGQSTEASKDTWGIIVVGPKSGDACMSELVNLPPEALILATGSNLEEIQKDSSSALSEVRYDLLYR